MMEQNLRAEDIERIAVGCSHMTFVHTAWPLQKPAGATAAQMNLFYGLAVIALHRDGSVRQYAEDRLADPAILNFIQRISAFEDDGLEAMGPPFRHARSLGTDHVRRPRLTVRTPGSARQPGRSCGAGGDRAQIRGYCVRGVLSDDDAAALRGLVMKLETLPNVGDLTALLRIRPQVDA